MVFVADSPRVQTEGTLTASEARSVMGQNYISGQSYKNFGWKIRIPKVPARLTADFLRGHCEVAGGPIAETNRLAVVPAGKSALELAVAANAWCHRNSRVPLAFRKTELTYLAKQPWARREPDRSEVVLMPMKLVPGSRGTCIHNLAGDSRAQQELVKESYPDYQVADPRLGFFVLVMDFVQNKTQNWPEVAGKFLEHATIGYFDRMQGLQVGHSEKGHHSIGAAVFRTLDREPSDRLRRI